GYAYDTAGRLAALSDPASGTTLSYSYNAMDEVSQIAYGSGGNTRSFGYDNLNELTSDTLKTAAGATVASIGYGYDPDGNLTSKTTTGFAGATANTYTYDEANRLTSWNNGATTTSYAYDGAGNLTQAGSKTYRYDARDELTSDGAGTYSYTANGTLASQTTSAGTVTSATDAYGQQVSSGPESFGSDALGRTVSVSGPAGVAATLSYAGSSGLMSSDGTAAYTWDPSGNLTGIAQASGGVLAYTDAHTDVVGNFTASGSSLSGSAVYDPWGMVTAQAGTPAGRLGYQSQYTDPASGQVDMGARWYSPERAGFSNADTVNVDPVPDAAAANPFGYAGDNPLNAIDPTGHSMMMTGGGSGPGSTAEQQATHPCGSACQSHPPQTVSASQFRQMQAHNNQLKAQAAARERAARERAARERAARARKHHSCGFLGLACAGHAVASGFDKARHAVASGADAGVKAVTDAGEDVYTDVIQPDLAVMVRVARDGVNAVKDAAEYGIHAAGTVIHYAAQAGSRAYHAVTRAAAAAGHAVVHVVNTAWHAVSKAATATVAFVRHHAALITSIVVGVAVFAGCEAVTAGVGSIGCAALAGAASNMAAYAVTAAQTGHFSADGLLMAGATGALVGAVTAGLLEGASGIAGGLLGSGAEDAAASMAEGAAGEAGEATTESAASTADASGESAAQDTTARGGEDDAGRSCAIGGQSLTAGTKVLLASGQAVAISTLHKGQKVLATDTRTGKDKAETVVAVLVRHDHDLYDLTVRAGGRTAVIDTTRKHLFWDPDSRRWIKAAALKHGSHLRTPFGGTATVLGGRSPRNTTGWMWDLTITPSHDFYVRAATTAVLVHNISGCGSARFEADSGGTVNDLQGPRGVRLNETAGNAFRDTVASFLRSNGRAVTTDAQDRSALTFRTPSGIRILDLMVQDSNGNVLGYVETKWGSAAAARYVGSSQEAADTWLRRTNSLRIDVVLGKG
ncbi:MAG: RHS repeat-associated core domain-containing protein, partial [Streptosporangiaceae bacterium]